MKGTLNAMGRGIRFAALFLTLSVASGAQAQSPQATPPPPASPRAAQFPRPVEQTLANGLRVIVAERSTTPLVTAQLLIKSGGEVDPPELSGLANMTAALLTKGTNTRTAPQIAEQIEALGGSLNSSARWDASTVTVDVMSSKIAAAMEILADVARHPAFKDEEIERLRRQNLNNLTVALGQPGAIASFVAARVVFGDAPYGHPISGTLQSLPRIRRDDIIKVHASYYRPDNAVLVFGGDIKPKDAFALAARAFGDWSKPSRTLPTVSANSPSASRQRVVVVDKPDAGQTAVLVARVGIARTDPDYFRGLVANSVLSGYSGRLNKEIRIKRGLSYGAGSTLDARRYVGPFTASAQTKNESGAEVAALALAEIGRLATGDLPDSELTPRKAVLVGNFARGLETTGGLVAQVGSLALYGLSFDEINRYISRVEAIRAEDVKTFAAVHLNAKDASVIVVGDAKKFLPALQKEFPQLEVIPVSELDLNSANLRRAAGAK